jgi:glycosyltransferase involved in cell wall biosynthesis
MKSKNIWITWEDHRRSRELASAFDCEYVCFISKRSRFFRYIKLSVKTFLYIYKSKPEVVFCQNPSVVLALWLCIFKNFIGYRLVVDRHSNFKFSSRGSWQPIWLVFHWISDVSLKRADVTIVTNSYLRDFVNSMGGCAYVLPDKIPQLLDGTCYPKKNKKKEITFISTFSDDEPIFEVVKAASILTDEYIIYITGSYKKFKNLDQLKAQLPTNVVLTGFLPESDYQSRLLSSDAILVITTSEHTLTCGAYEAVALGKPMVLGNTRAIVDYFNKGAVYTEIDPQKIAENIVMLFNDIKLHQSQVAKLKEELESDWKHKFDAIANKLCQITDAEKQE